MRADQPALRLRVLRIRSLRLRDWIGSVRRLRASLRLRRLRWRDAGFIKSPYGSYSLVYGGRRSVHRRHGRIH